MLFKDSDSTPYKCSGMSQTVGIFYSFRAPANGVDSKKVAFAQAVLLLATVKMSYRF